MNYKGFSWEKFRSVLRQRDITERQFVQYVYGEKTRMGVSSYFKGNFGIDKLLVACNYLNCRPDDILEYEDVAVVTKNGIAGILNTSSMCYSSADVVLRAENASLKLLIAEKDARIADLQRTISYLANIATVGQSSDSSTPPVDTL